MKSGFQKEFPLLVFCLCFIGLLIFLLANSPTNNIQEEKPQSNIIYSVNGFTRPFLEKDIWWLEKVKWRSSQKILQYFQGRSLGLHHVYKEHLRKTKSKAHNEFFGIYMEISEEGYFKNVMPAFTNKNNEALAKKVSYYIQKYWRYTKAKGTDKLILLIRFDVKQPPILEHAVQSK